MREANASVAWLERATGLANAAAADAGRAAWHAARKRPLPPLLPPGFPMLHGQIDTFHVPSRLLPRAAELLAATVDEGGMVELAVPTVLAYMVPASQYAAPARCNYLWMKLRANFSRYWAPEMDWFHPVKLSFAAERAFFNATVRAHGWHTDVDRHSADTLARLAAVQTGDC